MEFAHIVVGAGISGLGAAHFAVRAGHPTLVLERSNRIGGCINSHRFAACDDFWTEAGSHTCFNSYGNLLGILEDLDQMPRLTAKAEAPYKLWRNGRRESVFSRLHPLEALISLPRLRRLSKPGASVGEYYSALLGRRNYREVLGPAFQALICQPPDDYPAELLFRRKPRRKDILRKFTMPEGLSEIPTAIAQQADIEVRTGQDIAGIEQDGKGYRVRMQDGTELSCQRLTLAVPPDTAVQLLPQVLANARAALSSLAMAEIDTLLLVFRTGDIEPLPPLAGLIAVDDSFYSAVSRDYLTDKRFRGFAFHFRPGVLDAEEQINVACHALGGRPSDVVETAHVRNRLPALRKGHQMAVAQLDADLSGHALGVTGNWFFGVSMEDSLTRSRQEIDRILAI